MVTFPASAGFGDSEAVQSSLESPEFVKEIVPWADVSDHTPLPLPAAVLSVSVQLRDRLAVCVPSGVEY